MRDLVTGRVTPCLGSSPSLGRHQGISFSLHLACPSTSPMVSRCFAVPATFVPLTEIFALLSNAWLELQVPKYVRAISEHPLPIQKPTGFSWWPETLPMSPLSSFPLESSRPLTSHIPSRAHLCHPHRRLFMSLIVRKRLRRPILRTLAQSTFARNDFTTSKVLI